jgi:tRNA C32,U32 (ribose-2'-O)-methylase TrmJ
MKNKIEDLRNHLFETIEMLKDDEKPMEIDRAKAISDVAGTIIESAKVEVRFAEVVADVTGKAVATSEFFEPKTLMPTKAIN